MPVEESPGEEMRMEKEGCFPQSGGTGEGIRGRERGHYASLRSTAARYMPTVSRQTTLVPTRHTGRAKNALKNDAKQSSFSASARLPFPR